MTFHRLILVYILHLDLFRFMPIKWFLQPKVNIWRKGIWLDTVTSLKSGTGSYSNKQHWHAYNAPFWCFHGCLSANKTIAWVCRLKLKDTGHYFGNCQRPVFSLTVSQHMHKITNLWKFKLNRSSKLRDKNGRKNTLVTRSCVLSDAWFRDLKF